MKTVPWPHLGPHDTDVMPFSMVERDHVHSNKDPAESPPAAARCLHRMTSPVKAKPSFCRVLLPLWSCTTLAVIFRVEVFQYFIS